MVFGDVEDVVKVFEQVLIGGDGEGGGDVVKVNFVYEVSGMMFDVWFEFVLMIVEECIQLDELWKLLEKKFTSVCYDGFESSGRMYIAQGVMKVLNVNKLMKIGCYFKFWVVDWFVLMNNKMGGDLKKI